MANIGSFKKSGQEFQGEIVTLSLQTKGVRIVPETDRTNDNAPSHRVYVGRAEIGAAWPKRSSEGRDFLSVIRAMPSARALLVASLLTEPPYGCLGPSGNDRYRKRSLRSQTVGASQVNCQVAAAFAMNLPPADVFGQALLVDAPHDPNCMLSQIAASAESLLAWELGPGNQRARRARTAREKRRLRSGACG